PDHRGELRFFELRFDPAETLQLHRVIVRVSHGGILSTERRWELTRNRQDTRLRPQGGPMSERSSVYARVRLSRAALQRFLDALIAPIDRYQDWGVLGAQVPSFLSTVRYPGLATNRSWLDQVQGRQEAASDWTYETGEFRFHMMQIDEDGAE